MHISKIPLGLNVGEDGWKEFSYDPEFYEKIEEPINDAVKTSLKTSRLAVRWADGKNTTSAHKLRIYFEDLRRFRSRASAPAPSASMEAGSGTAVFHASTSPMWR
jgi:hypothetical protein